MATIKSYTDLEQSKKLAEILPLKSADLKWFFWTEESIAAKSPSFGYSKTAAESYKNTKAVYLPCWSLPALINILPDELEDNHFLTLDKEGNEYCCCYEDNNGNSFRHTFADNPVDACVAMIEKLHELKML